MTLPTGWTPDFSCCTTWSDYSPAVQDRALSLATGTLWALTGRRFGFQSVTARPCNAPRNLPLYQTYQVTPFGMWGTDGGQWWGPYIVNGEWHNAGCAGINCCKYQQCWPFCTDTFLVTYDRGVPVPAILDIALGDLACEYAKACAGAACALPSRVTSLTRQGVSVDFADPKTFDDIGLTNVASVDRIVSLVNPGGLQQAPTVMSPDTQPVRYRTWP